MKLNPDLIRDILIAVSESLVPDEYGDIPPIYPIELTETKLSQYSRNEALYWIRQLMDCNIIIKGKKYIDEPLPHIKDLSLAGYQFIENTSKPAIWEKIRTQLIEMAISNLPGVIRYAIEAGSALISQRPDIHF